MRCGSDNRAAECRGRAVWDTLRKTPYAPCGRAEQSLPKQAGVVVKTVDDAGRGSSRNADPCGRPGHVLINGAPRCRQTQPTPCSPPRPKPRR